MNAPIPRKHLIVLALSAGLAIISYWIPLPRESQSVQPELSQAKSATLLAVR